MNLPAPSSFPDAAHVALYLQPHHENFDVDEEDELPPLIRVPPPPTNYRCRFTLSPLLPSELEPNRPLPEDK